MFNKEFWKDTLERSVYTMAETAIGVLGGCALLTEVNWSVVISASVLSGIVTVLKCIAINKNKQ